MVDLTADLFQSVMNISGETPSNTVCEYIIDLAISEINLRSGEDLPTMTGTAASKTVSLTTQQFAAVMEAARAVYYGFYKGLDNTTIEGMTVSSPDLKSDPNVNMQIERAARRLAEFDVDTG